MAFRRQDLDRNVNRFLKTSTVGWISGFLLFD
jgi:hypothetical protein